MDIIVLWTWDCDTHTPATGSKPPGISLYVKDKYLSCKDTYLYITVEEVQMAL
jgi:hypothetical protein